MTPRQILKEQAETAAKVARWKARPLPYCVTVFDQDRNRSRPFGKRRFATVDDAVQFAIRNDSRAKHGLFADWAGYYDDGDFRQPHHP